MEYQYCFLDGQRWSIIAKSLVQHDLAGLNQSHHFAVQLINHLDQLIKQTTIIFAGVFSVVLI